MTLEELLKAIDETKEEITPTYEEDPGYAMCKEFLDNNKMMRAEQLTEIDIWKCMKCLAYLITEKKLTIEECEELEETNRTLFEDLDYDTFKDVISVLYVITDLPKNKRDLVLLYIEETSKIRASLILGTINEKEVGFQEITEGDYEDSDFKRILKEVRELEQTKGSIRKIVEFIERGPEIASKLYMYVQAQKHMRGECASFEEELAEENFRKKIKAKMIQEFVASCYNQKNILTIYNNITRFVSAEEGKRQSASKEARRIDRNCERAKAVLIKADQEEEITNLRELVRYLPTEDLKRKALMWAQERNAEYYLSLEKKLEELSANSINLYMAILNRYHIAMDRKDIPTLLQNTPGELEEILSMIPLHGFTMESQIKIIQSTNVGIAKRIRKYLDNCFITLEILGDNWDLYDHNSTKLTRFEKSVEYIQGKGINPRILYEYASILWASPEIFQRNIDTLESYNLLRALRTTDDFSFLMDPTTPTKLDLMTELGYYEYLEEDIGLINTPKQRIKRLELLKRMNIPVEDIDTLYEVLEGNDFIVKDEELDKYLIDYASLRQEKELTLTLEQLKEKATNSVSASIGGEIFSLPKIERLMKEGYRLEQAMFVGKRCDVEEYKKIQKALKPYQKTKKREANV